MKKYGLASVGWLKERYCYAAWSAWLVLGIEFFSRSSVAETFLWSVRHLPGMLLNVLLVGSLLLLTSALTRRPRLTYGIVSVVVLVLAAISGVKLRMLNVPLLPNDYLLLHEATGVISVGDVLTLPFVIGLITYVWVATCLAFRLPVAIPTGRNDRLTVSAVSVSFWVLVFAGRLVVVGSDPDASWDQAQNVRNNGFLLATVVNLQETLAGHRPAVDAAAVVAKLHQISPPAGPEKAPSQQQPQTPPNIIVVLSETFWDPTRMKGVTFSEDPIPNFHRLAEQYSSGWMLSPQFGGNTANVEMEVLTGLSMRFLPYGSVPYMQTIKNEVDSLASILSRQGYKATAVSPWPVWFFNSRNVYENFGFANFISEEFIRPVKSGPYIADSEVARVIIDQSRRAQGPYFIYANTAENHLPFPKDKFPENTIKAQGVSGEAKDLIETFAQGCHNADRMLQTLLDHFSRVKEPTILLWFGDHLPALGKDLEVFEAGGLIDGRDDPDYLNKMYQTPLLVWNNYLPPHKDRLDVSPSVLGPYLLHLAKRQGTPFTDYVFNLSQEMPVLPPRNRWADYHISVERLHEYEALQHDILFGDRQAYGDLRGHIIRSDYTIGYGPIVLDHVAVSAEPGASGASLTITGQNLPPTAVLYIGDTAVPTTWTNYEAISAQVPRALYRPGSWEIQVRVISPTKRDTVTESNRLTLTFADD